MDVIFRVSGLPRWPQVDSCPYWKPYYNYRIATGIMDHNAALTALTAEREWCVERHTRSGQSVVLSSDGVFWLLFW